MAVMGILLFLCGALVTGGVIDFISIALQRRDVQAAADAASLAAARELLISSSDERLAAVASTMATANLSGYHQVKTSLSRLEDGTVEVLVSAAPRVFFMGPVAASVSVVDASAVATVSGAPVCMIGLDTKVKHTLWMQKEAQISARGCAVYSNSLAPDGILIEDKAQVDAQFICSAGGVKTAKKLSLEPEPLTDCPAYEDPLAQRPPPVVGGCDHNKKKIEAKQVVVLKPGVYCKGIEIKGDVQLEPGVYVIKNGPIKVSDGGKIRGAHVGFFLTGKGALINFEKDSSIRLTAPADGPLAGLLFYEDRKVKPADATPTNINYNSLGSAQEHRISSRDATELVGTIYISRNRLLIGGENPIAAQSAYTVIIAREFALAEGPQMVLNTNYSASDVPVPAGVGDQATLGTRLVR
jgi:hypothetical protein